MTDSRSPGSLTRTVMRGAGYAGTGYALSQAINLAIYLALARLASPADFGQLAAGSVLVAVGSVFAESGMMAAVIHRRDRVEEAASTACVATLVGGLGLSLLALALSPLVGAFFQSHDIALVAAAASGWVILRSATIVPSALLQRRFSFVRRLIVEPVGVVAFGIVAIALTAQGMGVWGLLLGQYAQFVAMLIATWALIEWRPRLSLVSFGMWRELASYGRHVLAAELVRRVTGAFVTAILGRVAGSAGLGQYTYASRLVTRPNGAVKNIGSFVLFPAFSRISEDLERFRRAFLRALRWYCVVVMPISLMFLPIGSSLVLVLFGDPWRDAGPVVMALCTYLATLSLNSLATDTFKSAGRPDVLPRMYLTAAVLTPTLMLSLSTFGLVGLAAGISISSLVVSCHAMRQVSRILEMPLRGLLDLIWPPVAAAGLMVAILYPIERFVVDAASHGTGLGLLLLAAEGAFGLAVYVASLATISPASARALRGLVRTIRDRIARRRSGDAKPVLEGDTGPTPVGEVPGPP